ncbi:MAG: hypothetical protein ACRBK7_22410, partial [Acidimicrobiales bacterium]
PELPTRWLVVRKPKGTASTVEPRQWIIESDYLAPLGVNRRGVAVDIPYADSATGQPFRHLGRSMPIDSWPVNDKPDYLKSLTAAGFGDPSFAAYYPSCFSVFGFRDPEPPKDLRTVEYLVMGWYPDADNARSPRDPLRVLARDEDFGPELLAEQLEWTVADGRTSNLPDRILCYAKIDFRKAKRSSATTGDRLAPVKITVANTPGEALAAHMAKSLVDERSGIADPIKARAKIETQLEALELAVRLDEDGLSLRTQVEALQHRTRFSPVEAGTTWRIRVDDLLAASPMAVPPANGAATEGEQVAAERTPFTAEVLDALAVANDLQDRYDHNTRVIEGIQRRMFADWYKYMIALYPPEAGETNYPEPDKIRFYIERGDLARVTDLMAETGKLDFDPEGQTPIALEPSSATSLAAQLVAAVDGLATAVGRFHSKLSPVEQAKYGYTLETVPGGRFWEANNPVVMITGDAAKPTTRHGEDGVLSCNVHQGSLEDLKGIEAAVAAIETAMTDDDHGLNHWNDQPWNPIVLEWKLQLYSLKDRAERFIGSENYSLSYIESNYEAPILSPELEIKPGRGAVVRDPSIYLGSTILTGQASTLLRDAIIDRLVKKSPEVGAYLAKQKTTDIDAQLGELKKKPVIDRLLEAVTNRELTNPTFTLLSTLSRLQDLSVLSQELGGFNEGLIQHKDTIELAVDDPINFDTYRTFSRSGVQTSMVGGTRIAPSPQNAFNPIRAGALKLLELKLVDTFGQTRALAIDEPSTTSTMTTPGAEHLVRLAPRLAQPARLSFKWLAAHAGGSDLTGGAASGTLSTETEASTAEAGPICGWLLPNLLDRSLAVYDGDGRSLGYFKAGDERGVWRIPPGGGPAPTVEAIDNVHLRRVVDFIRQGIATEGADFVGTFIGVVDDALDNIATGEQRSPHGSAALMGRPVAVVRASIDLQLMGAAAVSHSWDVFRRDMDRKIRTTAEFTKVRFPVRIGEYGQLGDGLIGYWLEERANDGTISFTGDPGGKVPRFYAPQSDYIDTATIETRFDALSDGAINFHQCIDDPPQQMTLLVDPRGKVHGTVGILPRRIIDIPQDQYVEALNNIEVNFLHAPLLTPVGRLEIPLRPLPGYDWTWVEERDGVWHEFHPIKRLRKQDVIDGWNQAEVDLDEVDLDLVDLGSAATAGDLLWSRLIDPSIHWVELLAAEPNAGGQVVNPDGNFVLVAHEDKKRKAKLTAPFAGHERLVLELLDRVGVGIDPVETQARFGMGNEIRDGWLKLRRSTVAP